MQEAQPTPEVPVGFRNRVVYISMFMATIAGGLLCFVAVCLSAKQIDGGRIKIPANYRLNGTLSSSGILGGKSNDILSGTIQGDLSGNAYGSIRGDLSGSVSGSLYGRDDRFNGSLDGRTNGDFRGSLNSNLDGQVVGRMQSNTLSQFSGRTEESGTMTADITPSYSYYNENTFDKPGKPWLCIAIVLLGVAFLAYLRSAYQIIRRKKAAIESTAFMAKLISLGGLAFFAGADSYDGSFLLGLGLIVYAGIGYLAYTRWDRVRAQLYKS